MSSLPSSFPSLDEQSNLPYSQPYTVEVLLSQNDNTLEELQYSPPPNSSQDCEISDYISTSFPHDKVVNYKHIPELIDFVNISPWYAKILVTAAKSIQYFKNNHLESDAMYVASTTLKIIEDGFRKHLMPCERHDVSNTHSWKTPSSVIQMVLQLANKIEHASWESCHSCTLSVHVVMIHWLLTQYDGDTVRSKDGLCFAICRMWQQFYEDSEYQFTKYKDPWQSGNWRTFLKEHMLEMGCQSSHLIESLIGNAVDKTSIAELLVLQEICYLYMCNVPLHVVMSALVYAHELRELPFGVVRALNYVYALSRRFVPHKSNDTHDESLNVPLNLFLDQPVTDKSNRPTSLWYTYMQKQRKLFPNYTGAKGSLEDLAILCPQYARMRVCVHWDNSTSAMNDYDVTHAWTDAYALCQIIQYAKEKRYTKTNIIPHTKVLCGGPLNLSYLDLCRTKGTILSDKITQKINLEMLLPHTDMKKIHRFVQNIQVQEDSMPIAPLAPHADYNDWVWVADVCRMIYEVFTCKGPRGFGSFTTSQDIDMEQSNYIELLKMNFSPQHNETFEEVPHLIEEPDIDPSQITYHLYRHNPSPINPSTVHRHYPERPTCDDIWGDNSNAMSLVV